MDYSLEDYIFSSKSLVEIVEDVLILPTIADFYKKGDADFIIYLESKDFKKGNSGYVYNRVEQFLFGIEKSRNKIELLGDYHPNGLSKIRNGDKIQHSNYPDYGTVLAKIAQIVLKDSGEMFPSITQGGMSFIRDYHEVKEQTENKKDIEEFYYNLGLAIPILLLIRTVDVNAENILISLPFPIFFDMEAMFSGEFREDLDDYDIENAGLVRVNDDSDSSVLTGGTTPVDSLLKPLICGDQTKPYIKWRTTSKQKYSNIPIFGNEKIEPKVFFDFLKKGYNESVKKILSNKENIKEIVEIERTIIRVLLRPTRLYRMLTLKSTYPQIFKEKKVKPFLKESLEQYGYLYDIVSGESLEYECEAMFKFQVPTFYSEIHSTEILSAYGKPVAKWKVSPYDIWLKYFDSNCSEQFYKKQLETIEQKIQYPIQKK